jgi:hypothetical protein
MNEILGLLPMVKLPNPKLSASSNVNTAPPAKSSHQPLLPPKGPSLPQPKRAPASSSSRSVGKNGNKRVRD